MKRITVSVLALFTLLLLTACGGEEQPPGSQRTEISSGAKAANGKTLNDLVEHFKAAGIPVSGVKKRLYERINAADGFAIIIADKPVGVYLFQKSDKVQTAQLEGYKANGWELSPDFVVYPDIRGEFLMLPSELNPHWEEIQAAFNSFPVD